MSADAANNAKLLRELEAVGEAQATARFICVILAARDGCEVAHFRGEAAGVILRELAAAWASAMTRCLLSFAGQELCRTYAGGEGRGEPSCEALRKFLEWARGGECFQGSSCSNDSLSKNKYKDNGRSKS